jgi:hypothetical protein
MPNKETGREALGTDYTPHAVIKSLLGTVVHAYNLSYLGCRDQKDDGLRPAQTKKVDLISISQA